MNRRGILIAGLAAAGAALVVIAIVASSGGFGSGGRHVVPELRGQRLDLAQSRLDAIGLDSDTKGGGTFGVVVSSNWHVCDQDPRPGVTAREVLLIVDRDCEWPVPDVTGLTLKQAKRILGRGGTPYVVSHPDGWPPPPAGARVEVCEEDPSASYEPTSMPIHLTVNRICELPDLTGLVLSRAIERLSSAGIRVRALTDTGLRIANGTRWRVCEQNPPAGRLARLERFTVYRTCELPDVTGIVLPRAVEKLTGAGVAVTTYTSTGRRIANGTPGWWVCEQDPSAYEAADRITLTVRRDCAPAARAVPTSPQNPLPYVEGDALDTAEAALAVIGVHDTVVRSRWSTEHDPAFLEVCHQDPPAGFGVARGHAAVLYVAEDCYSEWPDGFRK